MPAVSFIVPCYNYVEYISEAIKSILSVKGDDDEIIVIDDGSTDDTSGMLSQWIESNAIQYVYQDNAGVSAARNHGTRIAKKDYLYFLDADDQILAEGFNYLRSEIDKQPEKAMIFGGHCSIDAGHRRCYEQKQVTDDKQQNFVDYVINRRFSIANGGTVLIRRDVALKYPYPETLRVSEDFCVYAWILANESVGSIKDKIVEIKKHEASLRNQVMGYAEVVESLPDVLFDVDKIPVDLMCYRQRFYCNRLLSLFRALYVAGHYKQAKKTYMKAIQCRWLNIFKFSYLRKYLRCVLK